MAILKTITTTTPIVDADGVNAFGWLRVRPNAPFEYTDGGAISVTDSIIECQLVDGAIYAVGGVVSADLSLAPNTGASNSPETYYIVDLELNGTTDRQYWRIDSATGGAGSVDVEYVDVPRVPGPDTGSSDTLSAHLAASNPHQQYLLRSDTVSAATAGAVSDGLGAVPRLDPATGKMVANTVPTVAIVDLAVTTAKLEALAVTAAKLAANAVETAKILDANVTLAKMADLAAGRIIGRASGAGTGVPTALTAAQVAAIVESDIRSTLVAQTITNGVTTSAPSQDAVNDLVPKFASFGTESVSVLNAAPGSATVSVGLTDYNTRFYLTASIISTTAGNIDDFFCQFQNGASVHDFPKDLALHTKTGGPAAGTATVVIYCSYIKTSN